MNLKRVLDSRRCDATQIIFHWWTAALVSRVFETGGYSWHIRLELKRLLVIAFPQHNNFFISPLEPDKKRFMNLNPIFVIFNTIVLGALRVSKTETNQKVRVWMTWWGKTRNYSTCLAVFQCILKKKDKRKH